MTSVLPKLRALRDSLRTKLGLHGGPSTATVAVEPTRKPPDACGGAESCCRANDDAGAESCCRADDDRDDAGCVAPTVTGGRILFGSQTGTARRLAHKLANSLRTRHRVDLQVTDLADYDPEDLVKEKVALVVLSTYESADGAAPPDAARWFCKWASESSRDERFGMLYLMRVKFAVFGCGNREYGAERFNAAARALDADLARLGGERVLRRCDGDESSGKMEEQFHDWVDKLAERLNPEGVNKGTGTKRGGAKKVDGRGSAAAAKAFAAKTNLAPAVDADVDKKETFYDTDDEEGSGDDDYEGASAGSEDGMDMEDMGGDKSGEKREMVTPQLRAALTKQGYKILGSHSGVKLCRWTKAQLRGRGGCYKHSFYGIESHRCMETTPSLACANKCVFCWRHHTNPVGREWRWQMDDAETIVEKAVSEHRGMIKQMKGVPGVIPERFEEGMDPRHCALSLVGEPIMYPEIDKFVGLLHAKRISTFLVTNAQFPDAIKNLPAITQLYVSVDAATPETLKAIDRPLFGDYWVSVDARLFHRFFFPHTPSLPVAPLVKQRLLLSWAHVCRVVPIMMLPEDPARWYQSAARDKWSTTFPPAFPPYSCNE